MTHTLHCSRPFPLLLLHHCWFAKPRRKEAALCFTVATSCRPIGTSHQPLIVVSVREDDIVAHSLHYHHQILLPSVKHRTKRVFFKPFSFQDKKKEPFTCSGLGSRWGSSQVNTDLIAGNNPTSLPWHQSAASAADIIKPHHQRSHRVQIGLDQARGENCFCDFGTIWSRISDSSSPVFLWRAYLHIRSRSTEKFPATIVKLTGAVAQLSTAVNQVLQWWQSSVLI